MDQEIIESIDNYYNMKSKYEIKKKEAYDKLVKKMKSDNNTNKKISKEVKKLNYPCVNCKRKVNSIFHIKDNKLVALCGDSKTPCNLNIEILKGDVGTHHNLKEDTLDTINQHKENIFKIKLDLIFKLNDETSNFALFEKIKKELNSEYDYLLIINGIIRDLESIYNNDEIDGKIKNYHEYIQAIDIMKMNYRKENDVKYLKGAVDIYIKNIIPLVDELYQLKYNVNRVDKVDNNDKQKIWKYNQRKYSYYQTEINWGNEAKIISNVFKN